MQPTQIIPGLFLGTAEFACDLEWLQDNAVSLVINCTKDTPMPETPNVLAIRLYVDDVYDASPETKDVAFGTFEAHVVELVEMMHMYLKQGKTVYVHCLHGIQRSATLVCAYLVKYGQQHIKTSSPTKLFTAQYQLDKAIQFMLDRRPIVFCKGECINFAPVLKKYDKEVYLASVWNKA